MDKSTAEGKVHFRGKLLQAISVMQVCKLYKCSVHKYWDRSAGVNSVEPDQALHCCSFNSWAQLFKASLA